MNNPFYSPERALQEGLCFTVDSHHINHDNSKLKIKYNFPQFGIQFRYINKILKEMAKLYGSLKNQTKFKNHTVFSVRFDEQNEDGEKLGQIDFLKKVKY